MVGCPACKFVCVLMSAALLNGVYFSIFHSEVKWTSVKYCVGGLKI